MSYLIDKKEVKDKLDKLQFLYDHMPEDARACDVCFTLFTRDPRDTYGFGMCWCDYESPYVNYS